MATFSLSRQLVVQSFCFEKCSQVVNRLVELYTPVIVTEHMAQWTMPLARLPSLLSNAHAECAKSVVLSAKSDATLQSL